MTKQTKRLDIRDLPRDPQHFQGRLRTELVKMANYVRKHPKKAQFLVNTLETVINHVNANDAVLSGVELEELELTVAEQLAKLQSEVKSLPNKSAVIEQAAKVGLELSDESTRAELDEALEAHYTKLIEVQTNKEAE